MGYVVSDAIWCIRSSMTSRSCSRTKPFLAKRHLSHAVSWSHMDMTWVTDRIAVGGGIWNEVKMMEVVDQGVTHIINMQIEFDDRHLGVPYGVRVLWNPTDDDFQVKPPELFQRGVEFALEALEYPNGKVFIHCAAGVHRAPMMTL